LLAQRHAIRSASPSRISADVPRRLAQIHRHIGGHAETASDPPAKLPVMGTAWLMSGDADADQVGAVTVRCRS